MERIILTLIFFSILSCNSGRQKSDEKAELNTEEEDPCPEEWNLNDPSDKPRSLEEKIINDTIKQQILFNKIWFEIISPKERNGMTRAYLKFYRTDGNLEEEGFGIYEENPVVDFEKEGEWKYYDCTGSLIKKENEKPLY